MFDYPYTITYTQNRTAYIKISEEGSVIFTIPQKWKSDRKLLDQLFEKTEKMWKRHQKCTKLEKRNDEGILLFGEWVEWEDTPFGSPYKLDPLLGGRSELASGRGLEKKLKEILYEYAKERLDIFSEKLGKDYHSLTIRKAKSRRGSCSSDQKIMLNLSLIFLSRTSIQYVIAHEAAHLVEKNHSPTFRQLVKKLFPDYYAVRKSLKKLIIN